MLITNPLMLSLQAAISRSLMPALFLSNGCLIQDNDFESTGGGGNYTVMLNSVLNTVFRRNHFRSRPGLNINVAAGIYDKCGTGNVYEDNRVDGKVAKSAQVCP